jgi:hypothetical protein
MYGSQVTKWMSQMRKYNTFSSHGGEYYDHSYVECDVMLPCRLVQIVPDIPDDCNLNLELNRRTCSNKKWMFKITNTYKSLSLSSQFKSVHIFMTYLANIILVSVSLQSLQSG